MELRSLEDALRLSKIILANDVDNYARFSFQTLRTLSKTK